MIRGKFLTSNNDISEVISLRRQVFVDEQGYSAESEPDAFDKMAIYALVLNDDGMPGATARLYIDDDRFHIGRVCTLKSERGKGLADLAMRMLLSRAQDMGAGAVYLSSQLPCVGFYARYGFEPYGDIVLDEGVPHRLMRVGGDKINLEGSCGGKKHCENCGGNCEGCKND